jgi:hypothetical protein
MMAALASFPSWRRCSGNHIDLLLGGTVAWRAFEDLKLGFRRSWKLSLLLFFVLVLFILCFFSFSSVRGFESKCSGSCNP